MRLIDYGNHSGKAVKREENIQRRLEKGTDEPDGVKILGEWTALNGSGGYMIFETVRFDYAWTMMWSDLLKMDIIPTVDMEKDVMGLFK